MSKPWKPGRKIELRSADSPRPSRIRREPPAPEPERKSVNPYPTEREVWTVVLGVIAFGLAIAIIIVAISDYTK